jgi:hypothetical protein
LGDDKELLNRLATAYKCCAGHFYGKHFSGGILPFSMFKMWKVAAIKLRQYEITPHAWCAFMMHNALEESRALPTPQMVYAPSGIDKKVKWCKENEGGLIPVTYSVPKIHRLFTARWSLTMDYLRKAKRDSPDTTAARFQKIVSVMWAPGLWERFIEFAERENELRRIDDIGAIAMGRWIW